ncbi:helix-turn-helix transcriptional regulator [Halomarina pelagica]|uniref:helix-turn-helix transcriptional regulator n=1 Tax=Halomarina pelagica TaxID=2961599 RepID=UPI0020C27A46|nr:helix-turn-helix transcriptional regulator [Halomarina sp. BND7]
MQRGGNEGRRSRNRVTIEELYDELTERSADGRTVVVEPGDSTAAPGVRTQRLVRGVVDDLFPEGSFTFDEALVKDNLDELLLVLVGIRESKTHGKALMGDLARSFDSQLSPGTVYPRLHGLATSGLLTPQEMVRTKEYRLDERAEVVGRLERSMRQHLTLAAVLYAALEEL